MSADSQSILNLRNVTKTYLSQEGRKFHALDKINLKIGSGEFVSIMGPSGSGKTTLSNIIGMLAKPTSGVFEFLGQPCHELDDSGLTYIRSRGIGFIFQEYMLIEHMNSIENVSLALHCHRSSRRRRLALAKELLVSVGLKDHLYKKPKQLSGGQKQRVAVARALIKKPRLILADEPTGALDAKSREDVLGLLQSINRQGTTIVMVTHSDEDALAGSRLIRISEGQIVQDREIQSRDYTKDQGR